MVKVLVVCQANISRSQSLAHYLRALSQQSHLPVVVRSAGIDKEEIRDIWVGQRMGKNITPSPKVLAFMQEPQLMIPGKPPQLTPSTLVNKRLMRWADIVIAADAGIERYLKQHFPSVKRKVRLSTHYARGGGARAHGEMGMKDPGWPRNKPNPPEYEPGVLRGTPEAHRKMLTQSREIAEMVVPRWQKRTPFQTPRQRKKRNHLMHRLQRKR